MSKYPDIDDDNFYDIINKKYSKYKIPAKKKTLKQICYPKKFTIQLSQQFVENFINPKTPYKGLLVYHGIGSGKTCAAVRITENFKKIKRIIVVTPASLIGNFRQELRSPCAGEHYLTEKDRNQLKKLDPSSELYKSIIAKSDEKINKYYTIYSYNKFIKLIKLNELDLTNTLLVIDEIHNMISESGIYYQKLYETIHSAPKDMRLVIMTATPIYDKPVEIALTMNLLLPLSRQLPTGQEFINMFMDIKYTKKGFEYHVKNMDLFKDYVKGYVSYYRGAPPHVYPKTKFYQKKIQMSNKQFNLYKKIMNKEAKKTKVKDYVNVDISNNFFIGTRVVSNIVYPNNKIGEPGMDSMEDKDYETDMMEILSPKFSFIYRKIKRCSGTLFIYSNFLKYGGINTFASFLEHHGYKDYQKEGPGYKRFAIWSGDQKKEFKEEFKSVFNNPNNTDGSKIKIVLGSPSIKEGVTLLRVQQAHIIEPYWNFSGLDQVIGRVIRYCSHKDMPEEKQLVKVYIYMAVHPKLKTSIDQYIMKMAENKLCVNSKFNLALKESAVDCYLFKNANEEDIVCQE